MRRGNIGVVRDSFLLVKGVGSKCWPPDCAGSKIGKTTSVVSFRPSAFRTPRELGRMRGGLEPIVLPRAPIKDRPGRATTDCLRAYRGVGSGGTYI